MKDLDAQTCPLVGAGMSRRSFIRTSGVATATIMLTGIPGMASATAVPAWFTPYERIRVARLSELTRHEMLYFEYPDENSLCFLVQMEGEAGGGIGAAKDIIAFHTRCPHMGGPLHGAYKAEHAAVGPCPSHLSTFDLRRHGMIIAGHSTESLPQVVLEVDGDWIYAIGMMGLIFGRTQNVSG